MGAESEPNFNLLKVESTDLAIRTPIEQLLNFVLDSISEQPNVPATADVTLDSQGLRNALASTKSGGELANTYVLSAFLGDSPRFRSEEPHAANTGVLPWGERSSDRGYSFGARILVWSEIYPLEVLQRGGSQSAGGAE